MSENRWMSINKFMTAISEFTEGVKFVTVFFDDFNETKYNWSVKPIGFNLLTDKAEFLPYYDVHKLIPEMEFIQFKADKNKKMKELSITQKKLYKLIIEVEEKEFKTFKYHQSFVKEANQSIYSKVLKRCEEDRQKYSEELGEDAYAKNDEVLLQMMESFEDAI